jgi:hypothetical protein
MSAVEASSQQQEITVARLELSDDQYERLIKAADADGVSPAQWIANLLIKDGYLPAGYRVDSDPGDELDSNPDSPPRRNPPSTDP